LVRNWRLERQRDHYYKMAKKEGYRSRAAYKLLEIHSKYGLLQPGFKVLDLGCAPGGWLQVASKLVGPEGKVVGVDVKPVKPLEAENVVLLTRDIRDPELPKLVLQPLEGGKFDLVVSDVSPNISGVWEVDHARQLELAEASLKTALKTLKPEGNMLLKVFEGDLLPAFVKKVRKYFRKVKLVKPKASKPRSSEIYVLALGLKSSRKRS